MDKFITRFLNIVLITLVSLLVLNKFYVVEFSNNLRSIFIYLTLIIVLLTAGKDLLMSKSKFNKFSSIVILICIVVGGSFAVIDRQFNIYIYICLFFSLLQGFRELISNTA